jgi:hypothetical protein
VTTDGEYPCQVARETLAAIKQGQPLSAVIPMALHVAKLQGNTAEYAWLRLQLIDLDEDKRWNPPPELETVWQQIEAECDRCIPRNVRWAVYSDYLKSRKISKDSHEPYCASVGSMEAGNQRAQELESQERVLLVRGMRPKDVSAFIALLQPPQAVYERVQNRVRSYLERSVE